MFNCKLLESASKLPRFTMEISQIKAVPSGSTSLLRIVIGLQNSTQVSTNGRRGPLFAYFTSGTYQGEFIDFRKIRFLRSYYSLSKIKDGFTFSFDIPSSKDSKIICSIMSEEHGKSFLS